MLTKQSLWLSHPYTQVLPKERGCSQYPGYSIYVHADSGQIKTSQTAGYFLKPFLQNASLQSTVNIKTAEP